jgi:hypothetical protein
VGEILDVCVDQRYQQLPDAVTLDNDGDAGAGAPSSG